MKYALLLSLVICINRLISAEVIKVLPDYSSTDCINPSTEAYGDGGASSEISNDNGINLTQALQKVAASSNDKGQDGGWVIILEERGCYWLSEFHLIYNVSNVSIVGDGSNASHYSIHCADNVGLAFVQVVGLQILNVTVDGCGVSEDNVDIFTEKMNETIDMFHTVPKEIGYAVAIADCKNVMINNAVIMNTLGIGLMLISVSGDSQINDLQLLYNRASLCYFNDGPGDVISYRTIGGGMYVLFQDYLDGRNESGVNLSISKVFAYGNAYCQTLEGLSLVKEVNPKKLRLSVGSAGSIGIALAQQNYGAHVSVAFSEFRNNTGWVSSGVTIVMFIGVKESQVLFDNCKFIQNGFKDYQFRPFGLVTAHSGLLVIKNVRCPVTKTYSPFNPSIKSLIEITNSLFEGNAAEVCANIELILFRPIYENDTCQITFRNATMTKNFGMVGPVLCASSKDGVADFSDFLVELQDVTIVDNQVCSLNDNIQVSLWDSSGQMLFISINVQFSGDTIIKNNKGAGVIAVTSNIYLSGSVLFHRNSANFGGGLQLLEHSHIVMKNNTLLEFSENDALFSGGAIFVANSHLYASLLPSNCFLYFGDLDIICNYSSCIKISDLNISMIFRDNTAGGFGGTIFGSTLNDCPWYFDYQRRNLTPLTNYTALKMLEDFFPNHFSFTPLLNSSKVVSTEAAVLEGVPLDDYNQTVNSTTYDIIYPGEEKFYNISAYDSFGYRTNALLLSASDNPASINSSLSDTVYWFIHFSEENGTKTPLAVKGLRDSFSGVDVFSSTSSASMNIKVELADCGFGFDYDVSTKECICEKSTPQDVTCSVKNQTLTVLKDNYWYGPAEPLGNLPVYQPCFFDHCKLGVVSFRPYQVSSQCNTGFRREGLLCSRCENGTGLVFGSSRCCECNDDTLFWIPVFAVAGIFIIVLIAFFDISVAHGYISGFIFYCNCLNYFLPYLSTTPELGIDYIFVLVSWVNLNLGIESCFYTEMSELAKIGLRLVFPAYLYFLMFLIVILSKYSKTISKIHFSAGRTFATIFILTYFSIFGTCINLLGFTKFEAVNEKNDTLTYYGWLGNVSVQYGHEGHIYLVILSAILIVTFIIPIPLLLMFPPLLYRFRYTQKLKPILDAFWNPYRPSRRFWLGARSLFRFTAFFLALYVKFPTNVFTFGIIVIVGWFLQERFSPYDSFLRNLFDSFFIMNLVVVLFLVIHFNYYGQSYMKQYKAALYCVVVTAYIVFGVIIIKHLMMRFPYLKNQAKKICYLVILRKKHMVYPDHIINDGISDDDSTETDIRLPKSDTVTFTEFREPLLDHSINTSYHSTSD